MMRKVWIRDHSLTAESVDASSLSAPPYREAMKELDGRVQEEWDQRPLIAAELKPWKSACSLRPTPSGGIRRRDPQGRHLAPGYVRIQVDGQLIAHAIYNFPSRSWKRAARKAAVRIYTGNVSTGAHQLEVSVVGNWLDSGKEYSRSQAIRFLQGIEPKLLGVTLGSSELRLGRLSGLDRLADSQASLGLGLAGVLVAAPCVGKELRDLYFGEALYHAHQGHYFEALERLDTELGQYHTAR